MPVLLGKTINTELTSTGIHASLIREDN